MPAGGNATRESDAAAGIETTAEFTPFRQLDDVFSRAFWDRGVRTKESDAFFASYRSGFAARRGDGFTRRDFAIRNASWLMSDLITNRYVDQGRREGFQAPISDDTRIGEQKVEVEDVAAMAVQVKRVAKFFGASLCGITDYDERWTYESRVDVRDFTEAPVGLPEGLKSVIVLGHEMDEELVATYPSALAGAATGREYSRGSVHRHADCGLHPGSGLPGGRFHERHRAGDPLCVEGRDSANTPVTSSSSLRRPVRVFGSRKSSPICLSRTMLRGSWASRSSAPSAPVARTPAR